jgi:hypothetical protein
MQREEVSGLEPPFVIRLDGHLLMIPLSRLMKRDFVKARLDPLEAQMSDRNLISNGRYIPASTLSWQNKSYIKISAEFLCYSVAITVVMAFRYTYPLNIARSDASNYLAMITSLKSNLIHASGYPLVVGLLAHALFKVPSYAVDNARFLSKLETLQLVLHLILSLISAMIIRRVSGRTAACLFFLFWNVSTFFMSYVCLTQPEWLQADVIALASAVSLKGFYYDKHKLSLYSLSATLFTMAYLIKYNSIIFVPFPVWLMIIDLGSSPRVFAKACVFCGVPSVLVIACFVAFFHQPSTGTSKLNYDQAWVLLGKFYLTFGDQPIKNPSGLAAMRLHAISAVIPQNYAAAFAYGSINDVAPAIVRAPYRSDFDAIMRMSSTELAAFDADHPLPPNFSLSIAAVPVYYFVGLPEGEQIGVPVFWEGVFANPRLVFSNVLKLMSRFDYSAAAVPAVPLRGRLGDLDPIAKTPGGFLSFAVKNEKVPLFQPFWSPDLRIWSPGMNFFSFLHTWDVAASLQRVPGLIFIFLLSILFAPGKDRVVAIGLAGVYGSFVFASNFIFLFRDKEAAALWPFSCLLLGLFVHWAIFRAKTMMPQRSKNHPP